MNVLLISPEFLVTFWSWKHLLDFVGKKAAFPPLGLLTVAAMLPAVWDKRLVDMNVQALTDEDIKWADVVFIGGMMTQKNSALQVAHRCKDFGVRVVMGGPILEIGFENDYREFRDVDHLVVGETEGTLAKFLVDLAAGKAERIYRQDDFPDLGTSPIPMWPLIDHKKYACMIMQTSRGCPFDCGFCNIASLNGRKPRVKSTKQILAELDAIYQTEFRGTIMVADDNLIGNKKLARESLEAIAEWQIAHGYPFDLVVEVDVTIADDPSLMDLLVRAGVSRVFLGLETPNIASLLECGKRQNLWLRGKEPRDLIKCVHTIEEAGLIPMSGFIVGFDNDDPHSFVQQMINFIQRTGIMIAMVGVLQAIPGTRLYDLLRQQGRLQEQPSGNNTDCVPNFTPKMPVKRLVSGFKEIWKTIYAPREYQERIATLLYHYNPPKRSRRRINAPDLKAFMRANLWIGLLSGSVAYYYWKSLLTTLFSGKRQAFATVVALWIYWYHFQRIAKSIQQS